MAARGDPNSNNSNVYNPLKSIPILVTGESSPTKIRSGSISSVSTELEDDAIFRKRWKSTYGFVLACIHLSLGLGNVWRFPYIAYRHGGGSFVIAYLVSTVVIIIPLFFLETSLGQFSSRGPLAIWVISPAFKGIGYAMVIISTLAAMYFNMINSLSILYTFASLQEKLPWEYCDNWWNTPDCVSIRFVRAINSNISMTNFENSVLHSTGPQRNSLKRHKQFYYYFKEVPAVSSSYVNRRGFLYDCVPSFLPAFNRTRLRIDNATAVSNDTNTTSLLTRFQGGPGGSSRNFILPKPYIDAIIQELSHPVLDPAASDPLNPFNFGQSPSPLTSANTNRTLLINSLKRLNMSDDGLKVITSPVSTSIATTMSTTVRTTTDFSRNLFDPRIVIKFSEHESEAIFANYSDNPVLSTDEYLRVFLGQYSKHKSVGLSWQMSLGSLFIWIIVFAVLIKGHRFSGKVTYVACLYPYVLLLVIFIRVQSLLGSSPGIIKFFLPDKRIFTAEVWHDAIVQSFFSNFVCWGPIIMMASHNGFFNNLLRDSLIVPCVNALAAIMVGVISFAMVSYISLNTCVPFDEIAPKDPSFIYVIYPVISSTFPITPLWGFLIFATISQLGVNCQILCVKTLITSMIDEKIPHFTKPLRIIFVTSLVLFLLGLIFATKIGIYLIEFIDFETTAWSLLAIAILECVIVSWVYGANHLLLDIRIILRHPFRLVWYVMWSYVTPLMLIVITISSILDNRDIILPYPSGFQKSRWITAVAWLLSILPVSVIAGYFIYYFFRGVLPPLVLCRCPLACRKKRTHSEDGSSVAGSDIHTATKGSSLRQQIRFPSICCNFYNDSTTASSLRRYGCFAPLVACMENLFGRFRNRCCNSENGICQCVRGTSMSSDALHDGSAQPGEHLATSNVSFLPQTNSPPNTPIIGERLHKNGSTESFRPDLIAASAGTLTDDPANTNNNNSNDNAEIDGKHNANNDDAGDINGTSSSMSLRKSVPVANSDVYKMSGVQRILLASANRNAPNTSASPQSEAPFTSSLAPPYNVKRERRSLTPQTNSTKFRSKKDDDIENAVSIPMQEPRDEEETSSENLNASLRRSRSATPHHNARSKGVSFMKTPNKFLTDSENFHTRNDNSGNERRDTTTNNTRSTSASSILNRANNKTNGNLRSNSTGRRKHINSTGSGNGTAPHSPRRLFFNRARNRLGFKKEPTGQLVTLSLKERLLKCIQATPEWGPYTENHQLLQQIAFRIQRSNHQILNKAVHKKAREIIDLVNASGSTNLSIKDLLFINPNAPSIKTGETRLQNVEDTGAPNKPKAPRKYSLFDGYKEVVFMELPKDMMTKIDEPGVYTFLQPLDIDVPSNMILLPNITDGTIQNEKNKIEMSQSSRPRFMSQDFTPDFPALPQTDDLGPTVYPSHHHNNPEGSENSSINRDHSSRPSKLTKEETPFNRNKALWSKLRAAALMIQPEELLYDTDRNGLEAGEVNKATGTPRSHDGKRESITKSDKALRRESEFVESKYLKADYPLNQFVFGRPVNSDLADEFGAASSGQPPYRSASPQRSRRSSYMGYSAGPQSATGETSFFEKARRYSRPSISYLDNRSFPSQPMFDSSMDSHHSSFAHLPSGGSASKPAPIFKSTHPFTHSRSIYPVPNNNPVVRASNLMSSAGSGVHKRRNTLMMFNGGVPPPLHLSRDSDRGTANFSDYSNLTPEVNGEALTDPLSKPASDSPRFSRKDNRYQARRNRFTLATITPNVVTQPGGPLSARSKEDPLVFKFDAAFEGLTIDEEEDEETSSNKDKITVSNNNKNINNTNNSIENDKEDKNNEHANKEAIIHDKNVNQAGQNTGPSSLNETLST